MVYIDKTVFNCVRNFVSIVFWIMCYEYSYFVEFVIQQIIELPMFSKHRTCYLPDVVDEHHRCFVLCWTNIPLGDSLKNVHGQKTPTLFTTANGRLRLYQGRWGCFLCFGPQGIILKEVPFISLTMVKTPFTEIWNLFVVF